MATYEERLASMKAQRQDNGGVKGLYHANINVLDRNTLEDAMEHPENYPNLTVRVSGYAVNFVKLTREQQLDVLHRTFHAQAVRDGGRDQDFLAPAARLRGAGIGGLEELTDLQRSERLARMRAGELGSIHSWELVTAVDGPGTRMTIFLNGCPLRCLYCHNPDTFLMKDGEPVEATELLRRMRRYRGVFRASKGGITLSGGEVLMQPAFAGRLLAGAKKMGIHTCIDTSGFLGANASDEMLDNIDLVLLDVKSGDEETYKKVTGRSLAPTITFGDRLAAKGIEIWARFVLVPDLTDAPENVHNVARIIERWGSVSRVEVLPFHQMGTDKWDALGLTYQLRDTRPPEPELVESTRAIFRSYGFEVH